jgi:hypothetical protein
MSQRSVRSKRAKAVVGLSATIGLAMIALASASGVIADEAGVTRGDLHAFAAGASLQLSGHAQMVRTADGKTIVTVHVEGLLPNTTYGSHVHQQACGVGDADGHYRFDPTGPAAPPNEIWPSFTTNVAGIGNGRAVAYGTAGPGAVSVVVHAPGGAKIGCADLD